MKKWMITALVLVGAMSLAGCKKNNDAILVSVNSLEMPGSSYNPKFPPQVSFDILADENWTISSNQPWCTLTPSSGESGKQITVTASGEKYDGDTDRFATLTIRSGSDTKNINLVQKFVPTLTTNKQVLETGPGEALLYFKLTSNIDLSNFTVEYINNSEDNKTWFACYYLTSWLIGTENDIELTILANKNKETRRGQLGFREKNGGGARVLMDVIQRGTAEEEVPQ